MKNQFSFSEQGNRIRIATTVAAGMLLAQGADLHAQEGDPEDVPAIVVTATKQGPSRIIDVPLSIQLFSGSDLEATGAEGLQDVFGKISGLSGYSTGNGVW